MAEGSASLRPSSQLRGCCPLLQIVAPCLWSQRRPRGVAKAGPRSSRRLSRCPFALGVLAASRSHRLAAFRLQLTTLLQVVALQQIVAPLGSCLRRPLDVVKAGPRSSRLSRCPFALGVLAASRSHRRAASSLQLLTLLQIVALQQIVAPRGSCALSRSLRLFPLARCRPRC